MGNDLKGRHVAITGGTGALGAAVVARFVAAGALCHVPTRHAAGDDFAFATHAQVSLAEGVDLGREADVERFFGAIPELWASLHLAGGFAMAPLEETGRDDFVKMMDINAQTAFLCCRAAVSSMRKTGKGGRIVNVASRPGVEPRRGAGMAAYAASKAAVAALTMALAEELKGEAIFVNAIAPSTIDTPANRAAMPNADTSKWLAPAAAAETILFLASPANQATNGAVLPLYARA